MASNTIIVGRFTSNDFQGVLSVVRDWTLSGLLKTTHWVNLDTPEKVMRVAPAGESEFSLADWIAQGASDIGIYVLQPLRDSDALITFAEVKAAFEGVGVLGREVSGLVNVLVPIDKTPKLKNSPFFLQQVNYVAEPVDGFEPTHQTIAISAKSNFYSQHAAKELATVAGLWPGQVEPGLPNKTKPAPLEPEVLVGRSFLRYVDASKLVTSVSDQLETSANTTLPTPRDSSLGTNIEPLQSNELEYVKRMADSFVEAHAEQLKFKKSWPEYRSKVEGLSYMQSLMRFIKWAMAKTPEMFFLTLQSKLDDLKLKIAAPVQNLYGFDSKVAVIVGGVSAHNNPNGKIISGSEILAQLSNDEFANVVGQGATKAPLERPQPANPQSLWRDFVEATAGLADGSKPSTGNISVQFPDINGRRHVVTKPDFIAPNVAADSLTIPVNIQSSFRGRTLTPDDPLAADVVLLEFAEKQRNNPNLTPADRGLLATEQARLARWISANNSFVWKVGEAIAGQINLALSAWSTLLSSVSTNVDELNDVNERNKAEVVEAYKRFFKGSKYIVGTGGLIWGVQALFLFITSGAWPRLAPNWWVWALIFVGVLALWNLLGPLVIWDQLKALHRSENAIDDRKDRIAYAESIRGAVWGEVHRLNSFYGQYLAWSAIVSPFIHRDGTGASAKVSASNLTLPKSLPNSMSLAVIESDKAAASSLAKAVESGFYETGWLLRSMQDSILTSGYQDDVWTDVRASENSELARLARAAKTAEFRNLVAEGSRGIIQGIASGSDAYRNATVKVPTSIDTDRAFTGLEFVSRLASGQGELPSSPVFDELAAGAGKRSLDRSNSTLFVDGSVNLNADITKKVNVQSATVSARKLDFMAIRFEVSGSLTPSDLAIEFEVAAKAEPAQTPMTQDDDIY